MKFNEFSEIAEITKMPIETQKLILIRMMKSVDGYHHFETIQSEVFEELSISIKELFEKT
jgi:hypothetical protein